MKRYFLATVAAIMTLILSVGLSWGYETQKKTDGLTIKITAGSYPLVNGDNTLSAKITDGAGKPVTDAKVTIRFYMPPMPGMAPMSSRPKADLQGDVYRFTANVPMEGTWKTEVSVARPGKSTIKAVFNLDSR
jgi:YtkA-like